MHNQKVRADMVDLDGAGAKEGVQEALQLIPFSLRSSLRNEPPQSSRLARLSGPNAVNELHITAAREPRLDTAPCPLIRRRVCEPPLLTDDPYVVQWPPAASVVATDR